MNDTDTLLSALQAKNKIWRVAHRGFHPENKLIGFRQAIENGCDMIECDLRLTADNHPVVIHDKTINRTTNGRGFVSKMKLHEIQFYGVPSLEDLIMFMQQYPQVCCAFEIKDIGQKNIILLNKTLGLIDKYKFHHKSIIISFNQKVVSTSKMMFPNICTGIILNSTFLRNPCDIAKQLNADVLWINYMFLRKVVSCNKYGLPIFIWTVNDKKHIMGLDKNVTGVVSDDLKSLYNIP